MCGSLAPCALLRAARAHALSLSLRIVSPPTRLSLSAMATPPRTPRPPGLLGRVRRVGPQTIVTCPGRGSAAAAPVTHYHCHTAEVLHTATPPRADCLKSPEPRVPQSVADSGQTVDSAVAVHRPAEPAPAPRGRERDRERAYIHTTQFLHTKRRCGAHTTSHVQTKYKRRTVCDCVVPRAHVTYNRGFCSL